MRVFVFPGFIAGISGHVATVLVIVEVCILLASVFARYVLHAPLVWSDELAVILLIWIVMLGAVVASHENAHMRLDAVPKMLGATFQQRFDSVAAALSILLLGVLLHPAYEHFVDSLTMIDPGLGTSAGWRSAPILIGVAAMLTLAIFKFLGHSRNLADGVIGMAMALGIALAAFAVARAIPSNWTLGVFFLFLLPASILIGLELVFAFLLATVAYLLFATEMPLSITLNQIEGGIGHIVLLSVPMFLVLGLLAGTTGIARALVGFLLVLIGRSKAGLSYALLGAMYLVSGISGAKAADMAAISPIVVPEMRKRGTDDGEIVSLLASSAAMSETIPPSLVLIILGATVGVSIGELFTAGLLPALFLALILAAVAYLRTPRTEGPTGPVESTRTGKVLLIALPALLLPILIRSAVIEGVATATEVATLGIVYSIVVGILLYRSFRWRDLYLVCHRTAVLSGAVMIIFGAAKAMAWSLTQSGFPQDLMLTMKALPGGKVTFMLLSIVIFIVLGSVLEGIPAIALVGPFLFPIARALGIDEIHYAMVAILAMGIGLFAPPFGIGYFTACAVSTIHPDAGLRRIWPYLGALLIGTIIIAFVPWVSLAFLHR